MNNEKLQKVLARIGVGSRREVETWIEAGRIFVDGDRATLGQRITGREHIRIDGQPIILRASPPRRRVLLYHKPEGEVCTKKDPRGRPTIFDHLPMVRNGRWVAVGRLDFNTSGLIILTTDGQLAHRLMHPSLELEREYAMRVLGPVNEPILTSLCTGVSLTDGQARFEQLTAMGGEGVNHWYRGTLKEGRNREVRRLWESQNIQVNRLIRVRFGPVALSRGLRRGRWEEASQEVVKNLLTLAGMNDSPNPGDSSMAKPQKTSKNQIQPRRKYVPFQKQHINQEKRNRKGSD